MPEKKTKPSKPRCPICGKPEIAQYRPFCSPRCAHLDLGKWLNGDYRIAAEEEPDLDDEFPDDAN